MNLRAFLCLSAISGITLVSAWAHCQIPCGIYDDAARFKALAEHITTIEKSITEIGTLEQVRFDGGGAESAGPLGGQ